MKSLAAPHCRPGLAAGNQQPSVGAYRRFSAAPLRLHWQHSPFQVVTQQTNAETQSSDELEVAASAMRAAKETNGTPTLLKPVIAQSEDLKEKFNRIQAEVSAYKKLEEEKADLATKLTAQLEEQKELSMQLQNAQGQLERLGEAVEVAEADRAAAEQALQELKAELARLGEALQAAESEKASTTITIQVLQDENRHLLLALSGAVSRLAGLLFPPGCLPIGLSITTQLEGRVDLQPVTTQPSADDVSPAAAATALEESDETTPLTTAAATNSAAAVEAKSLKPLAAAAASEESPAPRRGGGFFSWLLRGVCFWVYQAVGALLLYYVASILRGAPPVLNLEFGLGCVLLCTVLPWVNRLMVPRAA